MGLEKELDFERERMREEAENLKRLVKEEREKGEKLGEVEIELEYKKKLISEKDKEIGEL